MTKNWRYPWPASRIDQRLMRTLYAAREAAPEKTTITQLIAKAVDTTYAGLVAEEAPSAGREGFKEAA
jgi:hypothetical protein